MESPIAIVGMSCRFAGCNSPNALWNVIMRQESRLTLPGEDAELGFGHQNVFNRPYPTRLGQLGELYACVPSMQNFPRQVNAGENQDLYFATGLAFEALADAGLRPHLKVSVKGSVRLGYAPPFNASTVNWLQHTAFLDQTLDIIRRFLPNAPEEAIDVVRSRLVDSLPAPNAASFLMGSGYRFASWIARECAFAGTATTMDAGILTGAATLMDAASDLLSGRADVALAGTVTPPLGHEYLEGLSGEVEFSTNSELYPFSENPSGTIPGEGGAFFVLKRREDALRDHDRIYALIKSIAIGHTADDDNSTILSEAAALANIPVTDIGLIEADGSGIKKAETRELNAIRTLWGEHKPGGPLVGVGSIKGNIGHTLRSAIAAGTVKAALALYHRLLPPQTIPEKPADAISNLSSSAYLLTEARPWIIGNAASPRRAAVLGSNFDAVNPMETTATGGRSAAIILEEEPEERR